MSQLNDYHLVSPYYNIKWYFIIYATSYQSNKTLDCDRPGRRAELKT